MFNGDSALYEQYALSMLETGEYLAPGYGSADTDPMADMIRPPGYPLLIAAVYAVFGTGFWGKVGLLLLNLAGGVALWFGIMSGRAAHALDEKRGARGAPLHTSGRAAHALILIFDLGLLLFSKEILTEMVFAPLMVWFVGACRGGSHPPMNGARAVEWARTARPCSSPTAERSP